ncbi:MAG: hypothetical protein HYV37_01915 [Candidatus Levyibacteriota bacterium]|nr:MAG: hypothetical protein HYV37_01915 [Candidatus Levybacteria bacterium]
MTTRHKIELETISFVFLAAFLSSVVVWQSNKSLKDWFYTSLPFNASNKTDTVVTPVPGPKVDIASQTSPDGVKLLTMKKTHNSDSTFTYVFTTSDQSGSNQKQIYTVKAAEPQTFGVPYNAWSPDNKYVFIQKNGRDALIFKANGEEIGPNQMYFDVEDNFVQKGIKNKLSEVTGWASETLVIANTFTPENNKISYWFEVPSKAIIQLSSQF